MTNPAVTVVELVQEIKRAVQYVEQDGSVRITCLELNVRTVLERTATGEYTWKVVTLGGSATNAETQTLTLKLEPSPPGTHRLTARETLEDDLITAINAIKSGVNEAERSEPRFSLQTATVEFGFTVTTEGKILISTFGLSGKSAQTHAVKLTLTRPARA